MNGIKYLLDTNIIIGLYQSNSGVLDWLQPKQIRIQECAYSAVTRIELLSYPAITDADKQAIESLLSRMKYCALTPEIENATILFRRTHQTKLPDSLIAATAQHHQLELLTLDKKLASKLNPTQA